MGIFIVEKLEEVLQEVINSLVLNIQSILANDKTRPGVNLRNSHLPRSRPYQSLVKIELLLQAHARLYKYSSV